MWWIALVAAVGAALLAGCLGCGAFLLWRRKYGHGQKGGVQGAVDQVNELPVKMILINLTEGSLSNERAHLRTAVTKHAICCHANVNMVCDQECYSSQTQMRALCLSDSGHDLVPRQRQNWRVRPRG